MAYLYTYIKANPTQHLEEDKRFKIKRKRNAYKYVSSLYITYRLWFVRWRHRNKPPSQTWNSVDETDSTILEFEIQIAKVWAGVSRILMNIALMRISNPPGIHDIEAHWRHWLHWTMECSGCWSNRTAVKVWLYILCIDCIDYIEVKRTTYINDTEPWNVPDVEGIYEGMIILTLW